MNCVKKRVENIVQEVSLAGEAMALIRQVHPAGYWTYDHCAEESKKYRTLAEWRKKSQTSYNKARDSGWIKEFVWFKKNQGQLDLFDSI